MPNLTDIPSNVSVGFVTANGDPIYYGDYEVRKYLEQHSCTPVWVHPLILPIVIHSFPTRFKTI